MKGKKTGPGMPSRCCALLAAVLLTATLTAALLGVVTVHGLTSEDLHVRAAESNDSITEQMNQITAFIGELAEDYYFSAREVSDAFSADELREINEKMARWWTRMVNYGVMEDMPEWSSGKARIAISLSLDKDHLPEEMTVDDVTEEILGLIQKRVREVTMPVRKALIQKGFQVLRRRVDPADAVRFLSQGTAVAGTVSLALAGLIALLTGKKISASLRYYGAALAGTGISCVFAGLLTRSAGIQEMIREVSAGLAAQTGYILRNVTILTAVAAGILLIGGIACLAPDLRRRAAPEEDKI